MEKGIEAESTFKINEKNVVKFNHEEETIRVNAGKFCSPPYMTKFVREEVTKEYFPQ